MLHGHKDNFLNNILKYIYIMPVHCTEHQLVHIKSKIEQIVDYRYRKLLLGRKGYNHRDTPLED